MPLHKSSRAPRLDPTMISAPLGDFRHTMHIGRGGDAFGDTSFLSTLGPTAGGADGAGGAELETGEEDRVPGDRSDLCADAPDGLGGGGNELQLSGSVSSFTLDLDLDLGPSMLGDVLGVMDGLGLDGEEDVFGGSPANELNGKNPEGSGGDPAADGRIPDGNGIKPKGLRPKVRFSDKREEIIRQASEEDDGHGFDLQDSDQPACQSPAKSDGEGLGGGGGELANHKADLPPSPASSHSSEYEGLPPLDRRRGGSQSETDSEEEEEEEAGRGYTFEDEFDDEIGL